MARIRTIKPRLWESLDLAEVSRDAVLTFIGLISHADDEGRLRYKASSLREAVFPERTDTTDEDLIRWIDELRVKGLVKLYGSRDGRRKFVLLPTFNIHQRISKPQPSIYPAPGGSYPFVMQDIPHPSVEPVVEPVRSEARNDSAGEWNGMEWSWNGETGVSVLDQTIEVMVRAIQSHNDKTNQTCNANPEWWNEHLNRHAYNRSPLPEYLDAAIDYSNKLEAGSMELRPGREWGLFVSRLKYVTANNTRADKTLASQESLSVEDAASRSLQRFLNQQDGVA